MKEVFFSAEGFETHGLIWNENKMRSRLVLIVPGNPGVAVFYIPFASAVAASLSDGAVVVVGHAGHDQKRTEEGGKFVGLREQVLHKEAVLRHFGEPKDVVLIGHSVGSYVIVELIARGWRPSFVVHLCPTFSFIYEGLSPFVKAVVTVMKDFFCLACKKFISTTKKQVPLLARFGLLLLLFLLLFSLN
jgi:pimeloyl-ACP methyl ester carboxylesterase